MIKQDARWAAFEMQSLQEGPHLQWIGGGAVRYANNAHALNGHTLVVEHAYSAGPQHLLEMGGSAKLLVIAANKKDAEGRNQLEDGLSGTARIEPASIEQITGQEDDCGIQLPRHFRYAPRKAAAV